MSDLDFPPPKTRPAPPEFAPGDPVIVTTTCEDITLHELTGVVSMKLSTGSYSVVMDVDGDRTVFLPAEIGHRY